MQPLHGAQAGAAAQVGDDGTAARGVAMALGQCQRHEFVGQAVKAVAAQAALPGVPGQGQHFFHIGQRVVKGRVEAGYLREIRQVLQQRADGFERERLVQWRQRYVAAQVFEHARIHAHRVGILGAAMHHAVRHGRDAVAALRRACQHAAAYVLQRRVVGVGGIQRHGAGRHAGFAKGGRWAGDAVHLAVPQRLARQGLGAGVEERELDARRAAVQDQNQVAHIGAPL